mmetsp:Transcript_19163/g.47030  ORF Transcript_19163/g.47030 Transcript_19163/m.47030 type:complete len:129 (+) Transcript_19163:633-1019(+)
MLRGEVGREMHILERGEVQVTSADGHVVTTLGPGSYFGEIALVECTIRTSRICTITDGMIYTRSKRTIWPKSCLCFPAFRGCSRSRPTGSNDQIALGQGVQQDQFDSRGRQSCCRRRLTIRCPKLLTS